MRERWLSWGRRLQMAGLAGVVAAGVVWAGSPAGAVFGMAVSQTENLHDGDVVQVELTDVDPALSSVDLMQCTIGATDLVDCNLARTQSAINVEFGSGSGTFTVRVLGDAPICDATTPCALFAVQDTANFSSSSTNVTISFAADATTTTTQAPSTTSTTAGSTTTTTTSASSSTTSTTGSGGSSTTTSATGPGTTPTTIVSSTRTEATAADPLATKVSSPVAGQIQVTESKAPTTTAPAGLTLLGAEAKITGPAGSATTPLRLEFRLDNTILQGKDEGAVVVLRNGTAANACTGSTQASPDPCVVSRAKVGDDAVLTVLTSQLGTWNFAVNPLAATTSSTASGATTTTTRSGSASAAQTTTGGTATLPVTGVELRMWVLLVLGVGLAGLGSWLRRQALRGASA